MAPNDPAADKLHIGVGVAASTSNRFEVSILVTERDEQGRAVGWLLHDKPYAMPDYVSQADGRVVDGEGRDLGTTIMGDVAISGGH